jgi:hypothetical protein
MWKICTGILSRPVYVQNIVWVTYIDDKDLEVPFVLEHQKHKPLTVWDELAGYLVKEYGPNVFFPQLK